MIPNSVKLSENKKSILMYYDGNKHLILSSTKLRTLSPSAENKKNLEKPDFSEYQNVSILRIESVGNYAIRIVFDDGHNTGIYSWEYLHEIGSKF